MKWYERLWNPFNWFFGGGTKAKSNVIDLAPALTMAQAKKVCDNWLKVRYVGWKKGEFVFKVFDKYWKRQGRNTNIEYHWDFSGPDSMGSWEIV